MERNEFIVRLQEVVEVAKSSKNPEVHQGAVSINALLHAFNCHPACVEEFARLSRRFEAEHCHKQ